MAVAFGSLGIHVGVTVGLDPGRDKVGWAFVGEGRELLMSGIFPAGERALFWQGLRALAGDVNALAPWTLEAPSPRGEASSGMAFVTAFVVGDGTWGGELASNLEAQDFGCPILRVDERGTTLEARILYWRLHGPFWWQRLLPRTLWVPPRPLDDLAAWAIAMRGMAGPVD